MSYTSGHNPYHADSTPDYGVLGVGGWDCSDWAIFLTTLRSVKGDVGKQEWLQFWNDQSFWNVDYSFCKYDASFYNPVKEAFPDESHILAGAVNSAKSAVDNTAETVANLTGAAAKTTKTIADVLPYVALAFLVIILVAANKRVKAA